MITPNPSTRSLPLHRDIGMTSLLKKHDPIAALIPKDRQVAFLDYPLGVNVGDLLIMLGTLAFFDRHGLKRRLSRSLWNTERKGRLPIGEGDTIVLQGGGNFGDLYPHIQAYRARIAAEYPDHRIVIMPQTVFFKSADELARSAERLNRHPDLTLVVRDTVSFELAKPHFGERLMLAPDMAHELWPGLVNQSIDPATPSHGPLFFMRVDEEQADGFPEIDAHSDAFVDWHNVVSTRLRIIKRLYMEAAKVQSRLQTAVASDELYFRLIEKEVRRIAASLADKSPWITSRLHGFILGTLLDKPVVALDNSYGKLSSYIETWRADLEPIKILSTPLGARDAACFAEAAIVDPDRVSWADYAGIGSGELAGRD